MSADCLHTTIRRILDPADFGHELAIDLQNRSYTAVHSIARSACPILPSATAGTDTATGQPSTLVHADFTRLYQDVARHHHTRMVRVIDEQSVASMQPELARVALHAACGARMRVVPAALVSRWVQTARLSDVLGPVGDVIVVGPHVYRLRRGHDGTLVEIELVVDADFADAWRVVISTLYDRGEHPGGFYRRTFPAPRSTVPALPYPRASHDGEEPGDRDRRHAGLAMGRPA